MFTLISSECREQSWIIAVEGILGRPGVTLKLRQDSRAFGYEERRSADELQDGWGIGRRNQRPSLATRFSSVTWGLVTSTHIWSTASIRQNSREKFGHFANQ